jgi:peptidoglycan L-alanyl-D-glutamate endopeptidase CwlK
MALMSEEEAQTEFLRRRRILEGYLADAGMHADITEFGRTVERQYQLYGQGRTISQLRTALVPAKYAAPALPRVTNALPDQCAHVVLMATDYVPVVNGKRTYSPGATWWVRFGYYAKKAGLEWGGSWRKLLDRPHVQLPNWAKLRR